MRNRITINLVILGLLLVIAVLGSQGTFGEESHPARILVDRNLDIIANSGDRRMHTYSGKSEIMTEMIYATMDIRFMTRRALGVMGKFFDKEDKEKFSEAMVAYLSMLYSNALGYVTEENVEPGRFRARERTADYSVIFRIPDGRQLRKVKIRFLMHRRTDQWLIHDMQVNGISFIQIQATEIKKQMGCVTKLGIPICQMSLKEITAHLWAKVRQRQRMEN